MEKVKTETEQGTTAQQETTAKQRTATKQETAAKQKTEANQETATIDDEAKKIAVISYITIIGLVIAFVMNNDKKLEFASYHIRQSVGLCLTGLALGVIGIIPILGWIINLVGIFVLLYMWVMALMNAINEKEKPAPILGEKYQNWFKNL